MNKEPNEGPRHAGNVTRQNSLKPNEGPSQAVYDDTCEKIMRLLADWDYPGNVVRQAFHKPPAPAPAPALAPHVADSGQSSVRAGSGQPGQPDSPRVQPAGAGAVLEVQDRLGSGSASQKNNLVVQEHVDGQLGTVGLSHQKLY